MAVGEPLYKLSSEYSHSTNSFLRSAPVELTTVEGYRDFIEKKAGPNCTTVLEDDMSRGYIVKDEQVIADIYGAARDHLVQLAGHH
ncbi:uncharacterized protein KNAG_0J02410 [Huiozyma naganishii CBS 8797]|uniref:Uncharacterized protein n=1 Tax=Huiozyma naganishii (strain ATCC MYA-139 / BCRC 22969 / CBS 8797 / KCTC 17520 / NBRC 10181 / NCYC 3082 / Yp74L-3) TaxID=1071383 RepID=J7SAN1_HUIN7|nr:hypothetical protein KNAG_0J02410 [Kazachstania naganishii CBS 8797]CCK72321.1 hypothetical protein KNAG_0J02410 [Kazachstania naganishii CBS 8797]